MDLTRQPFTLSGLREAYRSGITPAEVVAEVHARIATVDDPALFIHLVPLDDTLVAVAALGEPGPDRPLWGMPFVIKDNIDAKGLPTTAACPAFAYSAEADAFAVDRLRAAGAILIGKTNLDQFATGLVGVRSPYGVPRNALDPALVPGGSSSGSAVAVAHGIVPFSLGTDTAGSGGGIKLTIKDVAKSFGGVRAVTDVSADIQEGEIFAIIGPNGAGKTTLLRALLGLVEPNAGTLRRRDGARARAARARARPPG